MQKEGGVYKIPCVVNGLRLKFIFDTGASNVCISLSEATLMLENGYLDKNDIVGVGKSQIADGSIINNTQIILREININGLILKDVEAIVINELKAPLLLGLTAIEQLGKIQIDGDDIIVINAKGNNYSQAEIDEMFKQADTFLNDNMFAAAAEIYQKLYDIKQLPDYAISDLADAYRMSKNYSKALNYYLEIQHKPIGNTKEEIDFYKFSTLLSIGKCYCSLNNFKQAEIYVQKSKPFYNVDFQKYDYYSTLVEIYAGNKDCYSLKTNLYLALQYEAKAKGLSIEDIYNGKVKDDSIASSIYYFAITLFLSDCGESKAVGGLMVVAAKNGNKDAKEYCELYHLDYL